VSLNKTLREREGEIGEREGEEPPAPWLDEFKPEAIGESDGGEWQWRR
jgi:hypothetical protein